MLSKNDLFLLLTEIENQGIDVNDQFTILATSKEIPIEVVKFINSNRKLEANNFYELIRKNYNTKKSTLYKNLVREEYNKATDVLTTLASLNLQILLFANKLEDNKLFLTQVRAEDIVKVLEQYYKDYDLLPCYKLLKVIRTDLLVFEYINGRRDKFGKIVN